jgi:aryl sulfotransferase
MTQTTKWPHKTHELHSHHFDSTIWNDLKFRDDDIVIATYAKSGTTWMQQIIAQMLYGPDAELEVAEMSPWLDLRVPPKEVKLPIVEAQTHRRFLKTHLPVDALVFSPGQNTSTSDAMAGTSCGASTITTSTRTRRGMRRSNDTPGRVGPPIERPPATSGNTARVAGRRRLSLLVILGQCPARGGRFATSRT